MNKQKEIEILGLNLKIGRKEVTLTIEEAKKLHDALREMFANEVVIEKECHHYDHYPWKWYWTERQLSAGEYVSFNKGNQMMCCSIT